MATKQQDKARVRALIAAGQDRYEIAGETGWALDRVESLQSEILAEEERVLVGRRTEEVYVDYVLRTRANISELQTLVETLDRKRQGSAVVGAIRAKQDLLDKILDRGQDFGFLRREPHRTLHGVVVANMSDPELRDFLGKQLTDLRHLVATRSGDHHLLDVGSGTTEGPPVPEMRLPTDRAKIVGPEAPGISPRRKAVRSTSSLTRKKATA